MTTPETVGQFADAVRAAVDAERARIKAIVRDSLSGIYIVSKSGTHIASGCDEILRRIEEGR